MDDDANQLRFRNGELTAEVRMLNSKLTDANNANNYLLTQVSMHANDHHVKDVARLERQHKKAVREIDQLKAQIALIRKRSPYSLSAPKKNAFALKAKRSIVTTAFTDDSAEYGTDDDDGDLLFAPHAGKLQLQDTQTSLVDTSDTLVDLSEHQVLEPEVKVEEKIPEPSPKKPERRLQMEYGLMNVKQRPPRPLWEQGLPEERKDPNAPWDGMVDNLYGGRMMHLRQPDGTVDHIPMPFCTPETPEPQHHRVRPDRYTRDGTYFNDDEHNRLAGNAMFIEAMGGNDLLVYWQKRAGNGSRHTARQWREYYEANIRPAYLEKQRLRDEAQAAPTTSPESSPESTPISSFEDSKTLDETEASAPETSQDVTPQSIEVVEVEEKTTSVAVTAIHDDDTILEAEVEVKTTTQSVTTSLDSNYFEVVSQVSTPASRVASPQSEVMQLITSKTPESAEEDAISEPFQLSLEDVTPEPTQPSQEEVSISDMNAGLKLEPLPGLPELPPHNRERRPSVFQQVAAGNSPAQRSDNDQQKRSPPRGSRFMIKNIIPTVDSTLSVGEARAPYEPRPYQGGHPPRQTFQRDGYFRGNETPTCIEDLFAKPANVHDEPLAFRSVIMTIPSTINLLTALKSIRFPSATLFSSSYLETTRMKVTPPLTTNHILLVFLSGTVTQAFIKHHSTSPLQHLCPQTQTLIPSTTTLIPTATRPLAIHTQKFIQTHNLSRVLYITCPDGVGYPPIPLTAEVAWRALVNSGLGNVKCPLHAWQDPVNGKIYLEFASMRESKTAWDTMMKMPYYFGRSSTFGFEKDPCDGDVMECEQMGVEEGVQTEEVLLEIDDMEKVKEEDKEIAEMRAVEDAEGLACSTGDHVAKSVMGYDDNNNYTTSTSKEASEVGVSMEDAKSFECEILGQGNGEGEAKGGNILDEEALAVKDKQGEGVEMEAMSRELEG